MDEGTLEKRLTSLQARLEELKTQRTIANVKVDAATQKREEITVQLRRLGVNMDDLPGEKVRLQTRVRVLQEAVEDELSGLEKTVARILGAPGGNGALPIDTVDID
jgi:chromosome segregation ATPase